MDNELLLKIMSGVSEIRDAQREIRTKLFGEPDSGETARGRLPMLEVAMEDHALRIDRLEKTEEHRKGWVNGAAAVGGVVGSLVGGLVAYIGHLIDAAKK